MIRYKDRILEDYFIDPETAVITDKNGVVQPVKICNNRPVFKSMHVHCIMAHTYLGYKPGYDVHHIDENKMNNALSNLIYLTNAEHTSLHSKGKPCSEERKTKLSTFWTGKKRGPISEEHRIHLSASKKGRHLTDEQKAKLSTVLKGHLVSEDVKAKISIAQTGMKQFNNGIKNTWAKEKPGPEWAEGWIKKRRTE